MRNDGSTHPATVCVFGRNLCDALRDVPVCVRAYPFNLGVSISVYVSCQHAQAHQWFTTPSHNALVKCAPVTSRRSIAVHLCCACQSGSRPSRPPACSQHSIGPFKIGVIFVQHKNILRSLATQVSDARDALSRNLDWPPSTNDAVGSGDCGHISARFCRCRQTKRIRDSSDSHCRVWGAWLG